jgi:hypothetical protein
MKTFFLFGSITNGTKSAVNRKCQMCRVVDGGVRESVYFLLRKIYVTGSILRNWLAIVCDKKWILPGAMLYIVHIHTDTHVTEKAENDKTR